MLSYEKIIVGLLFALGHGAVSAHGASYDHSHSMLESPAIVLCLLVCVGVVTAVFKSSTRPFRSIAIKRRISEKK